MTKRPPREDVIQQSASRVPNKPQKSRISAPNTSPDVETMREMGGETATINNE